MLKPVVDQGGQDVVGRMGTPGQVERVLECPEKPGGDMPTPLSRRKDGSLGGEGQGHIPCRSWNSDIRFSMLACGGGAGFEPEVQEWWRGEGQSSGGCLPAL